MPHQEIRTSRIPSTDSYQEALDDELYDLTMEAEAFIAGKRIDLWTPEQFSKRVFDWCDGSELERILAYVVKGDWIAAEKEARKALVHPVVKKKRGDA